MAVFKTHTGLEIAGPVKDDDGMWIVTLTGDRIKEIYRGDNMGAAMNVRRETEAHYKDRAINDPEVCPVCLVHLKRADMLKHAKQGHS